MVQRERKRETNEAETDESRLRNGASHKHSLEWLLQCENSSPPQALNVNLITQKVPVRYLVGIADQARQHCPFTAGARAALSKPDPT